MKIKLHLDALQAKKTDRQTLLDFFDYFPLNPRFGYIKEANFVLRPMCLSQGSIKVINKNVKEFEIFNDVINYGKSNKDKRSNKKDFKP